MPLASTSATQNRTAYILRGVAYASLTTAEKAVLDAAALDALTQIQQIGQYFSLTAPASVPDTWESWFVQKTAMMAAQQMCPDRMAHYIEMHEAAEMAAIDAYGRNSITYDPGSTPEASVLTVQNIRYYVISNMVRRDPGWETIDGARRRRPRKWIPFELIDAQIERVVRNIWNRADWQFKRRQATFTLTPYTVADATYTHATKTITKTSGFATTIPAGSVVRVTAGTGATLGEYVTTTGATADAIILTASIGSAADGQTDIDCEVLAVTNNLLTTETFHDFATRELYFDDATNGNNRRECVKWASNDEMAKCRALIRAGTTTSGRPAVFSFQESSGVKSWWFYPWPDDTYTLSCAVNVKGPTLGSLTDTTTALARFPAEFNHVIKDAVYAEVLDHTNDPQGPRMRQRIEDEIAVMLPKYAEPGKPAMNPTIRDVYRNADYEYFGGSPGSGLLHDIYGGGV